MIKQPETKRCECGEMAFECERKLRDGSGKQKASREFKCSGCGRWQGECDGMIIEVGDDFFGCGTAIPYGESSRSKIASHFIPSEDWESATGESLPIAESGVQVVKSDDIKCVIERITASTPMVEEGDYWRGYGKAVRTLSWHLGISSR